MNWFFKICPSSLRLDTYLCSVLIHFKRTLFRQLISPNVQYQTHSINPFFSSNFFSPTPGILRRMCWSVLNYNIRSRTYWITLYARIWNKTSFNTLVKKMKSKKRYSLINKKPKVRRIDIDHFRLFFCSRFSLVNTLDFFFLSIVRAFKRSIMGLGCYDDKPAAFN